MIRAWSRDTLAPYEFATLTDYLTSELWAATWQHYRESGLPLECFICGRPEVQLHHRSYDRCGYERLDDLIPLCRSHHEVVERMVRDGVAGRADAPEVLKGRGGGLRPLDEILEAGAVFPTGKEA